MTTPISTTTKSVREELGKELALATLDDILMLIRTTLALYENYNKILSRMVLRANYYIKYYSCYVFIF